MNKEQSMILRILKGIGIWFVSMIVVAAVGTALKLHEWASPLYGLLVLVCPVILAVKCSAPRNKKAASKETVPEDTHSDASKSTKKKSKKTGWIAVAVVACSFLGLSAMANTGDDPITETTVPTLVSEETISTEITIPETTVAETTTASATATEPQRIEYTYILNTNSKKFHFSSCSGAKKISEKNRDTFTGTREEIIKKGYEACGICTP